MTAAAPGTHPGMEAGQGFVTTVLRIFVWMEYDTIIGNAHRDGQSETEIP